MELFYILYIYLFLPKVMSNVVSEENQNKAEKEDKTIFNIARRFINDLDDDQWHVSHLKDLGFDGNSKCRDETFEDKAWKYRKMLKNDGALVDFVSAHTLPFDVSDISQGVCRVGSDGNNETVVTNFNKTKTNNLKLEDKDFNSKIESANKSVTHEEQTVKSDSRAQVNIATTVKAKAAVHDNVKVETDKNEKSRRASEYMFSSAEYYDEAVDFDDSSCHGAVEVFSLEINQLRNYDVECEMLLEWRSLE